ncbi:MAG TPA: transporter substrate-binding domain-containing protein [Anaeromyxobacter sp.]|nr:transporter substrate-binding domain-containing protein [Anaeromyxobacter sp.]
MRRSPALALCAAAALACAVSAPAVARAQPFEGVAAAPPPRVVVGASPAYPPYEYLDRNGQPAGYNVDLTRAIAEVMGMQVEFRFGRWAEMRDGLMDGTIDILQGISYSDERAKILEFAPPHAIVHHAIFARKDGPRASSLDDLAGKEVIVFRGGILDELLTARGYGDHLVRTGTPADALRLLASGKHDFVALALLPGIHIVRELKLTNVVVVAQRVAAERYGYAVKKGNSELLARFDEGLAILKKTGRYDEIHARWLGPLEPVGVPWQVIAKWGVAVLLPLLAVLGATVLWSRSLKRQVELRTREVLQHQAQLVQADRMAALGVLVSGVAHEINNPNGLILLDVPILKAAFDDAREVLDAHRAEHGPFQLAGLPYDRMRDELPKMIDEMMAAGRRIGHIVTDLKDFARREDAPRLEPVDLDGVVRAAVRLVENKISKATSRFEVDLAPGLPRVRGNAQRIEQVLVNLLLNACEALPDPSRAVRLATRRDAARRAIVLEVKDEGVGIPPEHLPRLTDPFFTTKRESGGTGLGLSVSAGIVKEHGGTLEFRSRPGAGTTAILTLPEAHEEAAA